VLWECNECGGHITRQRPPAVCHHCGIAGPTFVRVHETEAGAPEAENLFTTWFRAGMERGAAYAR
jgi:ABC-type ATPase with predicted acetyltransferase domain